MSIMSTVHPLLVRGTANIQMLDSINPVLRRSTRIQQMYFREMP